MPLFRKKLQEGTNFIKAADRLIDNAVTNQEERGLLKNGFSQLLINFEEYISNQVTDRLKLDNENGSFLAKNVRPLVTLISVVCFFVAVFMRLNPDVIKSIKDITEVCVYFYFGSRGVQKFIPLISDYTKSLRRKG